MSVYMTVGVKAKLISLNLSGVVNDTHVRSYREPQMTTFNPYHTGRYSGMPSGEPLSEGLRLIS